MSEAVTGGLKRGRRRARVLAQSMMLAEEGFSLLAGKAVIAAGILVAALVFWAGFIQVDDMTRATGRVVPAAEPRTVSHPEGGTVGKILVKDGDVVEPGQPLIRLDAGDITEKVAAMRVQHTRMALLAAQLRALGRGSDPDFSFALPEFREIVDKERRIFASLKRMTEKRHKVLSDRVLAAGEKLKNIVIGEKELSRNTGLLEEELQLREDLYKKGLTAKKIFIDVKKKVDQARRDLTDLAVSRKKTKQVLTTAKKDLNALKPRLMERALDEFATLTAEVDALGKSLEDQKKRLENLDIAAPVKGVVKGINRHSPGAVLAPGTAIFEIAPFGEDTIIEARISPADIERLRPGQGVVIRAAGFNRFGGIRGRLKSVSTTTSKDRRGRDYYKATIVLDRSSAGAGAPLLKPGLKVEAEITTGTRSLIATLWD